MVSQIPRKTSLTKCGCGLATATGSCFGYSELMKRPTRMKFGMRLPRNWVSIADYVCVTGCSLILSTPIGHHYVCQILIYGLVLLKFGLPSPSNRVSIINYMWVWFDISHMHGSDFGYPKLIKGPTRPKFEWFL